METNMGLAFKLVFQNVKILLLGNFDNTIYKELHITEFY